MNCRQCVLRGRNIFIQFQRLERAGFGFEEEIAAGAQTEQPLIKICLRKVRVSLSVSGVDSNCLSIKVGAPRQVHWGKFLVQIICLEGKLISLRIDLDRPTRKLEFWINQLLNLAGYLLRYLGLELQDVTQLALISSRPKVFVLRNVDQLRDDSDSVA